MILTQPRIVSEVEAYRPLLELLDDVLVTSKFLAERYRYTEVHMANLRKNNRGWPYFKLATGGVRYRLSDIITAEAQHPRNRVTVESVCQALARCTELSTEQRAILQAHIRKAFTETDNQT